MIFDLCVCSSVQEPTPSIQLYYLTEAPSAETPNTPSRKRKGEMENSKLKKSRQNWRTLNISHCHAHSCVNQQ